MLKVLVFDSGWGGEMFADRLEKRVPVVEVKRVIDWRRAPYSAEGRTRICVMTEQMLRPYIGKYDVIVLASYAATVAAKQYLEWKYPEQKFVGFMPEMGRMMRRTRVGVKRVVVLATGIVRESYAFRRDKQYLDGVELIEPECAEWIGLVDDGEMTMDKMRASLGKQANEEIDAVLLYSTGFLDMKPLLEKVFGRRMVVIDEFDKVIHETCQALKLRGGDGRRMKK